MNNSSPVSCGHNQDEITSVSGTKVDQSEADLFDHVVQEKKDNDQPSFLDRFQMAVDCFCQCKQLRSKKFLKLKDLITRQGQFMFSVFEEGNNRGHALSQFHLAVMYQYGWHVAPDDQKAFSFMQKAAINCDNAKLRLAIF